MRRLISRTAALALCVTVALGAAAVPCAAAETPATKADGKLTSSVSREPPGARRQAGVAARRRQRAAEQRRRERRAGGTPATSGLVLQEHARQSDARADGRRRRLHVVVHQPRPQAGQVSRSGSREKGCHTCRKCSGRPRRCFWQRSSRRRPWRRRLTGSITGSIKDEQGAVLPGVTVTLIGKQGTKTQVTDAQGVYRFPALEVGTYVGRRGALRLREGAEAGDRDLAGQASSPRPHAEGRRASRRTSPSPVSRRSWTSRAARPRRRSRSRCSSARRSRARRSTSSTTRPASTAAPAYGGGAGSGNALLIDGVDTRDPSGGTAVDLLQLQRRRGIPVPGPRRAGGIRRLHRRGGQHDHQVGRQPVQRPVRLLRHEQEPGQQQRHRRRSSTANPTLADPAKTTKYADITTQFGGPIKQNKLFFFASAQRFLLETDPTGGVTRRHEVSPRLNFKLTWQPNAEQQLHGPRPVRRLQHHRPRGRLGADRQRRPDEPRGRARVRLDDASTGTSSTRTRSPR